MGTLCRKRGDANDSGHEKNGKGHYPRAHSACNDTQASHRDENGIFEKGEVIREAYPILTFSVKILYHTWAYKSTGFSNFFDFF